MEMETEVHIPVMEHTRQIGKWKYDHNKKDTATCLALSLVFG
jgi:hypothetical protein